MPTSGQVGATCPICQVVVAADTRTVTCPACDQLHCHDCWAEIGGCGSYGCDEAPELQKSEPQATEQRAGWGDTKRCPSCGETIKSMALRCRYCRAQFDTADPMSRREHASRKDRQIEGEKVRKASIVLFGLSVIGLLAPLILILSGLFVLPKQKALKQAGGVYLVLGFASFFLSLLYTLLMVIFLVAS